MMTAEPIPAAEHAGHNYANGYPPPAPKQPKVTRFWLACALIAAAGIAGAAIGYYHRPAPETVTVTKEVYKTPPSCITALDLNEAAFGYASDALKSIMAGDYTASGEASGKINGIAPQATQAKADCRAANQ